MTGTLDYYNTSVETPKYARVVFHFENEFNLAYISKRMFGRLGVVSNVSQYVATKSLVTMPWTFLLISLLRRWLVKIKT